MVVLSPFLGEKKIKIEKNIVVSVLKSDTENRSGTTGSFKIKRPGDYSRLHVIDL